MVKYNYLDEVARDVEHWMNENISFDLSQFKDRDEAAEFLNDELWAEDCITGNDSEGYASEEQCEKFLCHNLSLLFEACEELCIGYQTLYSWHKKGRLTRFLDCIIRCYVLNDAIYKALDIWEHYGFKYKGD